VSVDLQAFAKTNNCVVGVCDASPLDNARLQKSEFVPFVSGNLRKRTDPSAILPDVQSIIVFGVGASQTHSPQKNTGEKLAQLSSLGANADYHVNVKVLINKFINEITQHTQNFKCKILIDSPNLDERAFAQRAGIGFFGRNGLIISPEYGTRFNIGLLLTNVWCQGNSYSDTGRMAQRITKTIPLAPFQCPPNCNLCIAACPTNAIQLNKPLNTVRCISYLTQKKYLTADEELLLSQSNQLYGCDICQDVCPFNIPNKKNYIAPQQWLEMDDTAFSKYYRHTAMLWQGTDILRRNARLINISAKEN